MTVAEGKEYCSKLDAHLATIPNNEANFWVSRHFQEVDLFWIGLIRQNGVWNWEDGTNSKFSRWLNEHPVKEPQKVGTCAMANWSYEGEWHSVQCHGYLARVACSVKV